MAEPRFCTACGHRRQDPGRFCSRCGAAVTDVPDTPSGAHPASGAHALDPPTGPITAVTPRGVPTQRSGPPPPGHTGMVAAPGRPATWTVAAFTRGDWAGAAIAALSGVAATALLAGVAVLLLGVADAPGVSTGNAVALAAMLVAMAFGGSVSATGSTGFDFSSGSGSAGAVAGVDASPLLLTAVGLGVLTTVFLRRLRSRRATAADVVTQAARVWAVLCGALVVIGLVGRTTLDASLAGSMSGSDGGPTVVLTTGIAGTLFGATVWLAIVLGAVVAWRLPEVLPDRLRGWRNRIAGPAHGALVAVVVGSVLLLAGSLAATLADATGAGATALSAADAGQVVGVVLLLAPNLVLGGFGFAAGAPLVFSAGTGAFSGTMSRSLLDATDQSPQFWLAPLAVGIALVVGGVLAAVHAPTVEQARRSGWLMGVVLGLVLAVVAVTTAVSVDGAALAVQATGTAHLNYVLAPLAGLVWGALGGWVGALVAPGLPPALLHGLRRHVVGARRRSGVPAPLAGHVPAPSAAPGHGYRS